MNDLASRPLFAAALLCLAQPGCAGEPDRGGAGSTATPASVASGRVAGWPEATRHLLVHLGPDAPFVETGSARATGLDAFWSIASTGEPRSGFFYADVFRARAETRVAYAAQARSVSEIADASLLDWSRDSVGPVPVGGIVVVEHAPSRRYLALVLDAIERTDPRTAGPGPYALADVRWYLTAEGAKGF